MYMYVFCPSKIGTGRGIFFIFIKVNLLSMDWLGEKVGTGFVFSLPHDQYYVPAHSNKAIVRLFLGLWQYASFHKILIRPHQI